MFRQTTPRSGLRLSVALLSLAFTALAGASLAQSPTPTPTPASEVMLGGYRVTSSTEIGWRWRSVDGNVNKYRSDLNYKQGFRTFDTNLLLEKESGSGNWFDSLLVSNSGWGSDPSGYTRVNIEKVGAYKANFNVRRIKYFNNLLNHALNEHNQDTVHNLGDFDLTLRPQDERLRIKIGGSYGGNSGSGSYTTRAYSDEFPVAAFIRTRTVDWHVGVEGKAFGGFDYGLTQGFRIFKDFTSYRADGPNPGNNTTNTAALATFFRAFPTEGHAYFTQGYLHRTFDKKLDFYGSPYLFQYEFEHGSK